MHRLAVVVASLLFLVSAPELTGQVAVFDSVMQWRCIGPYRGGRSLAVAGHANQRFTYYFGATGGGVWKTTDGGETWFNVSDGFFRRSSVGAMAVAPSNPNVVVAGMGEAEIRGNCATGDGVYISTDAGETWIHAGLENTATIGAIAVHPTDEQLMLVAALGNPFKRTRDRGVYKTTDGGKSWRQVLFVNDSTGAVDVQMDPLNPGVVYAGTYSARRAPHEMSGGGEGSGLWKSTDGGETWKDISTRPGMPKGIRGKICIAPSRAQAGLVWAMVESQYGGLFKSEDAGATWSRVSQDKNIRQRPWYFSRVYADPAERDVVYVLNVSWFKSIDGGRTFSRMSSKHGDHHGLWIDPTDHNRMILADDGGATVSYNGGRTWTDLDIPTAQFYHVSVDNQFPYRIYGAQQDNSSVCIRSRSMGWTITDRDWFPAAGGESGYVVSHPKKPWVIFGGNYGGFLERFDTRSEQHQDVSVHPENAIGDAAKNIRERFQWTFPIVFSPHDSSTMYTTSQHVWKSTDEGMSWTRISGDLTRNDTTKLQASGGPITKDNTGVEVYCTIFAFAESPVKAHVLWAGSDDGKIHVSVDGGNRWKDVTPQALPEWALVSIIEPSHFDAATAYVAATRYKSGDEHPYVLKTTDYGATWVAITNGIPETTFTRVVREDPNVRGLLYCGTETGVYCSFNDGKSWQSLQLNLPVTPIHDIAVQARDKDLVVATHGRSFWVLDDVTPIHQLSDSLIRMPVALLKPRPTYLIGSGSYTSKTMSEGTNTPSGVQFTYWLRDSVRGEVNLEILDQRDSVVRTFSNLKTETGEERTPNTESFEPVQQRVSSSVLPSRVGMNRFAWDMSLPGVSKVAEAVYWFGGPGGITVPPGTYKAVLRCGGQSSATSFTIVKDPRVEATDGDFELQYDLGSKIIDKAERVNTTINAIAELKTQVSTWETRAKNSADSATAGKVKALASAIADSLTRIEKALIERRAKAGQDALNYPLKLNNKILALKSTVYSADNKPTKQAYEVFDDLSRRIDECISAFERVRNTQVAEFNAFLKTSDIPAVVLPKPRAPKR